VDYHLKKLIKGASTFLRDSQQVVEEMSKMAALMSHVRLFTSDATAMYTNIELEFRISTVKEWLETTTNLPTNFPTKLVMDALDVIMNQDVFQFDDTFWHQDTGTAMGLPCACLYVTLIYALHEFVRVLQLYRKIIAYMKRFINDMLGIWAGEDEQEWLRFKAALDGSGKLKWITSERMKEVIFLDLCITINNAGKIETKTYTKPMNLHLYTPDSSAHPDGCLRGTIFDNALRHWQ
jgi:hypothetical protein